MCEVERWGGLFVLLEAAENEIRSAASEGPAWGFLSIPAGSVSVGMFPCGKSMRASSDKLQIFRLSRGLSWRSSPSSLGSGGQSWFGPSWPSLPSLLKLELLSSGSASETGKLAHDSTNYPSKLLHKQVGLVCLVWVGFLNCFYLSGLVWVQSPLCRSCLSSSLLRQLPSGK